MSFLEVTMDKLFIYSKAGWGDMTKTRTSAMAKIMYMEFHLTIFYQKYCALFLQQRRKSRNALA